MRTMQVTRILLFAAGLMAVFLPSGTKACTCDPPTLVRARELSDAAFTGLVRHKYLIEPLAEYLYIVEVMDCWKGGLASGDSVQVWTATSVGACGVLLSVGDPQLFFVTGPDRRLFHTDLCSGNSGIGPWIIAELGPPGCRTGLATSTWSEVKGLYVDP